MAVKEIVWKWIAEMVLFKVKMNSCSVSKIVIIHFPYFDIITFPSKSLFRKKIIKLMPFLHMHKSNSYLYPMKINANNTWNNSNQNSHHEDSNYFLILCTLSISVPVLLTW